MADSSRASSGPLSRERQAALDGLLDLARRQPHAFGFLQLLRRVQHLASDRPRLGDADRPTGEALRLGQAPSMAFAPAELAELVPGKGGRPSRLLVSFFGVLGPNGPLPLHMTEYARDRQRNADDPTMARFFDVFHHRMLLFLFRAWAAGQPVVSRDRPTDDRFETYVGALAGLGLRSLRDRDDFPDEAKLFYAGRFGVQGRNADGLADVVAGFLRLPARVQSFMPDWLDVPVPSVWRLGVETGPTGPGRLGRATILGARVVSRQSRFRIVLGPLERTAFQRMLPGGDAFRKLASLVRLYAGDEQRWDVRLVLRHDVEEPWHLGRARLGWTSWTGRREGPGEGSGRDDLILDPAQAEPREARAA
jgi:type VI secretion system protein ImpH